VLPAQEGLDAAYRHGLEVEDGLIDQEELIVGQGGVKTRLEGQAVDGGRLHLGLEEHAAVLPHRLGLVEGDVGIAQQLLGGVAVAGGDADTGRHGEGEALVAFELERLAQSLPNALGHEHRAVGQR
jgi:hypothetical protein